MGSNLSVHGQHFQNALARYDALGAGAAGPALALAEQAMVDADNMSRQWGFGSTFGSPGQKSPQFGGYTPGFGQFQSQNQQQYAEKMLQIMLDLARVMFGAKIEKGNGSNNNEDGPVITVSLNNGEDEDNNNSGNKVTNKQNRNLNDFAKMFLTLFAIMFMMSQQKAKQQSNEKFREYFV